jgi:hypothetical protein
MKLVSHTLSIGFLDGGSALSQSRYLHTEYHKHRINAHRHPCLEWDSNARRLCSSGRRLCGHCERPPLAYLARTHLLSSHSVRTAVRKTSFSVRFAVCKVPCAFNDISSMGILVPVCVLGRTNRLLPLPRRKRRLQQFFYFCVCIRCRGNVFTQPLPSNDRGIHIQTHRLMGGVYEVRR